MTEPLSAARVAKEINRVLEDKPHAFAGDKQLHDTLEEIRNLDKDFEERGGVFFAAGSNAFETADRFTKIHVEEYRETGRPSLPALAVHHAEKMGISKTSPEYKAMIMVAVRAEMKAAVTPDYHSQYHYMDVAAMTANLLEKNNEMVKNGTPGATPLTKKEQALTFIAAIGHDLGHDGKTNKQQAGLDPKSEKEFNKTYNEQISFELMVPLLEDAGLKAADISKMHTILMTTSPDGPHGVLKSIAKEQREGRQVDPAIFAKFPELESLAKDKNLTQMAAVVSDSDLYASSGAGLKASTVMSSFLTEEDKKAGDKRDFTTDGARKFFLDNIVGKEGYASNAGRAVANESLEAMRAETERRIGNAQKPPAR